MFAINLTPGDYAPARQEWTPCHPLADGESPNIKRLTVATFNVWFGADYFNERCQAVLGLLESCRPDLVALQEVTPAFLQQVLHTSWVQAEYRISDIYGDSVDPYGVLILSRLPIREWQFFALPSAMGRHLVIARAPLNATVTTFASVHPESTSHIVRSANPRQAVGADLSASCCRAAHHPERRFQLLFELGGKPPP
jgi:hypothetical protein